MKRLLIPAEADEVAVGLAEDYAGSLWFTSGPVSAIVTGHVELITEVEPDGLVPLRIAEGDAHFRAQIPLMVI
jgi:hypothetical protein